MASLRQTHGVSTDRAFERLHRRHVADVYRYALVVLQHPLDAEAFTGATFANAYHALERGERPRHPQTWLLAIAHGLSRRRRRDAPPELEAAAPQDEGHPTAADVRRALRHLAFSERAALVMRELENRTCAEIAAILGLSEPAVETLLFRARRALRERLEGALWCHEAERAISRLADGQLTRADRSALRGHLRECGDCRRLARGVHAQRAAFRVLASVPVPASMCDEPSSTPSGPLLAPVSR